jgi:3-oxoacyl-[acyl-carrier protein] reductase
LLSLVSFALSFRWFVVKWLVPNPQFVALVTGASRGIGRAIALELSTAGYAVAANYRADRASAESLTAEIRARGGCCEPLQADIGIAADRERLVALCAQRFGRLDLLVNNAAQAPARRDDILEATEESFDHLVAVNLKGPYFLTQRVANWMLELRSRNAIPAGRIVFITSLSAYTTSTNRGDYCITKAGLSMASALFADRLAGAGMVVIELRPGIILTDMVAKVKEVYDRKIADGLVPERRWGYPEDVAQAVRAIAEGRFDFSTGAQIDISGGFQLRRL